MAKMRNVHVDVIRPCKKPMQIENCSAFGGSSTSGTLTSTDSNLSNKDVNSATLTSTDSNNSVTRASHILVQSPQIDVFSSFSPRALDQSVFPERPPSQSKSTSGSDLRQITVLERLTKTHPIWFLPTVARSGAVHLIKDKEAGSFLVRKSSQEEIMALSVQSPEKDGTPKVDHYLIQPTENGLHLQGSTKLFSSIPHLIANYCDNKEDLPHRLVLPPSVRAAKTSQELSALAMLGQDFWTSTKYDAPSKSRSSSRSNLSDHSAHMNKSVSEPISINNNNKNLIPAYSQSEALLQNTPPKHSVIDFSSYLIRKPDSPMTVSQNFTHHESKFTQSVQRSCSVTSTEERRLSSHVTSNVRHVSTCHSSEQLSVVNMVDRRITCNRNSNISVDYAQPDKGGANQNSSSLCFSSPGELLRVPDDYYFTSNLSDKLSDYEDIWKYSESNVGSVQADIVQRLQPNIMSMSNNNNNVTKPHRSPSRNVSVTSECFIENCEAEDGLNLVENKTHEVTSKKVLHIDHSAMFPCESVLEAAEVLNQNKTCESKCKATCVTDSNSFESAVDCNNEHEQGCVTNGLEPGQEHESDIDSNHGDLHLDDEDGDADTEEGDVVPKINSVHTQTSPLWKMKSPPNSFSRKSASTSSLSTMRTPVYAEPFDAICSPDEKTSENEKMPNLPKKQRRKSAPASSYTEKRMWRNEMGKISSVTEAEDETFCKPEFENIDEHEEVFMLSDDHTPIANLEADQNSKLEHLYETAWVDPPPKHADLKKTKVNKPKPSPRKSKQKDTENKSFTQVTSEQEKENNLKNQAPTFTINVLEEIKTLQEFGESHESPSSPMLNKFPVYNRQISMETRVSRSESSTAEDIISSWNPELTLRPIKPSPVLPIYSAMSEYDNLNTTSYMAPSGQSVASVGTVFCKPWENSMLAKIMKTDNGPTHNHVSVNSPPPVQTPPPLPPPVDMLERIKAWQESSQEYNDYPNQTLDDEYRLSMMSDVNSLGAVTSRGEISSNSEFRISSNGQNSQSSEKTLVNEKSSSHSNVALETVNENIPVSTASIRERVAPVLAYPRLLSNPQRNHNPGTKIREYIIRLSSDHSTTFGSTIENFIQCTIESSDTNPYNITRNVRQFMNGIKNYLVKHGEGQLDELIQRARTNLGEDEILNIDSILESSLHECVIQPLKSNIYTLFVNEYTRNGNLRLLSNNIKYARTKTPEEIGIRKGLSPPDGSTLDLVKQYLDKMQKSYSPRCKLENLLGATSTIYKYVDSKQRGKAMCFGADDFLPMLIYVLVHCGTLSVEIEADYMWGLLHPSLLTGEGGYYLTSLSSAVLVLKNFREMQETKASQQQGNFPSISDMQGFLKIALPNETNDTIDWRTLPVRPSMTTKDVCSMIAHKFKITNPQDYGLYTLENGEECRMMDMECPQVLKADRQGRGKECKFVYKRHAANIAWPKSVKQVPATK